MQGRYPREWVDELFARADHVTVHAPSIPATDNLIGAEQLSLLRDGATLVNTSRGSVIDHGALLAEAVAGRLYLVLDVTTPEPLPIDSPFRLLNNVDIVPHLSGSGFYGYHMIGTMTFNAIEAAAPPARRGRHRGVAPAGREIHEFRITQRG